MVEFKNEAIICKNTAVFFCQSKIMPQKIAPLPLTDSFFILKNLKIDLRVFRSKGFTLS